MKKATLLIALIALYTQAFSQAWNLSGNAGTNSSNNFLGTTDSKPIKFRTNNSVRMTITSGGKVGIGSVSPVSTLHIKATSNSSQLVIDAYANQYDSLPLIRLRNAAGYDLMHIHSDDSTNTYIGLNAGRKNDTTNLSSDGTNNTFIGSYAGANNTTGYSNTAIGSRVLMSNNYGDWNTACGDQALALNTYGSTNSAFGYATLYYNINGLSNTAMGFRALHSCSSGQKNTAIGFQGLFSNTTGNNNCAVGSEALLYNNDGFDNTAVGFQSLYTNSNGNYNTAIGKYALRQNTSGIYNTASGVQALYNNTIGTGNLADGLNALYNNTSGINNTAVGYDAMFYNVSGSYNTNLGRQAGSNNGYNPTNFSSFGYYAGHLGNNSNTIEIGNSSVSWIGGQVIWSTYSDKRIKDNIQSNVPGLEFINKLNPVTYNLNIHRENEICEINNDADWEGKYDIEKIVQTGFIAQEVEQAAKMCNYKFSGVQPPSGNAKLYSIQYAAFVVPLVKAVQELDKTTIELKKQNEELRELNELIISVLSEEQQQKLNSLRKEKLIPEDESGGLLFQNNPNPFTDKTVIKFYIPVKAHQAVIKIYNADGKEINTYSITSKGKGQIEINGNTLAAGTYSYVLIVDQNIVDSRQMVLF